MRLVRCCGWCLVGEWNYDVSAAPFDTLVLVSTVDEDGERDYDYDTRGENGWAWHDSDPECPWPMIVAWCLPPDHPPVPEPEYVFTKAAELKPTNSYHVTFKYESA